MAAPLESDSAMVWVIVGTVIMVIMVVASVLAAAVVDMLWPRGEPEAAQPEAGEPEAAEPDEADGFIAEIASPGPAEDYDWHYAQRSPPREPMHITTVEDVLAWGERMRAEISAWAQKQDPSPSPPEPAEAGRDPPITAR